MKKYLLLMPLLIIGCGDDLGWKEKKTDHDCADSMVADAGSSDVAQPQDVSEVNDVQSDTNQVVEDSVDATETDISDSSGSDDTSVSVPDSVTGEDAGDSQDAAEDVTQDVAPPPECVTSTDCAAAALPCIAPDCEAGKCVTVPADTPCSDNDECTVGDQCQVGQCVGGAQANCDDLNPCTDDSCDPAKGCVHLPNQVTCVDGNGCTTDDICKDGACVAGVPFNCDDGNVCTDDSCESIGKSEMHVCKHLPNQATCTDDNVCSLDDACEGMSCKSKSAAICDDSNICTNDSCDPITGCVFLPNEVTCTDNDACTSDDKCADKVCKSGAPLNCADTNDCTTDLCKPETGCYFDNNQNVCSDNNVCSVDDKCEAGVCVAGLPKVCDDANICTIDSCDPVNGCKAVNAADGTKCAEGICQNGACACVSGFGCASPSFSYASETNAGMLGGMGGQVGPKMGCNATDVIIGIGFDFSNGQKNATKTTVVCGKVSVAQDSTVSTVQTTTQKNGGSGCFGWDPSTPTPLVICPNGWAVVGIEGTKAGSTLFNNVKLVCGKLGINGKSTGETQTLTVNGTTGPGTQAQVVACAAGTIARYFETRAGCGQDALTLYCATPSPDCTGQELICKDL